MTNTFKRILSVVLSVVMVTAIGMPGSLTNPVVAKADNKSFTVDLGKASWITENSTFKLPNATITGSSNVTSLTVDVSVENESSISSSQKLDYGKFEATGCTLADSLSNGVYHRTATWTYSGGATVSAVQSTLRDILFYYYEGMKITVTVDGNKTELPSGATITAYTPVQGSLNNGEVHYYMYVPYGSTIKDWKDAYNTAKSYYFMGMQGYLVTITEREEDKILDNITSDGAWAGGVRLADSLVEGGFTFDPSNSDSFVEPIDSSKKTVQSEWYWACGPEKGMKINIWGCSTMDESDSRKDLLAGSYSHEPDNVNDDTFAVMRMSDDRAYSYPYYEHWNRTKAADYEPNNYPDTYSKQYSEWWLQVHYANDKNNKERNGWNDLGSKTMKSYIKGFFVEFSNYEGGVDAGNYSVDSVTTVSTVPFQKLTYTVTADDTDDTITFDCDQNDDSYTISLAADNKQYTANTYVGASYTDGVSANVEDTVTIELKYKGTGSTTYSESTTAPTHVGTYEAVLYVTYKGSTKSVSKAFSITQAPLTITAVDQTGLHIGDEITKGITKITSSGLLGSDAINSITLTPSKACDSVFDDGIITPSAAVIKSGSTDVTNDYAITYVNGKFTVVKAALTVATKPSTDGVTYGQTVGDAVIKNGVIQDGATAVTGTYTWETADSSKNPKVTDGDTVTYTVIFTPDASYNGKYDPIEIEIIVPVAKKTLTIAAPDREVSKGTVITLGTSDLKSVTGLVLGDTVSTFDYTADTSNVGTYSITVKDAVVANGGDTVTGNYEISYVPGVLKVTKLDADVTTDPTPSAITYGDSLEDSSFTGGVVTDENGNTVPGKYVWVTPSTEPVVSDSGVTDYEVKFIPDDPASYDEITFTVKVTVNKKAITVAAPALTTLAKDDPLPFELKDATVEGLVNGDVLTAVTFDGSTAELGESPVTPVKTSVVVKDSTKTNVVTDNYEVSVIPGVLKITKRIIEHTGTLSNGEITYGETVADSSISHDLVKDKVTGETVPGTWSWKESSEHPTVDDSETTTYTIVFTPTDTVTYDPIEFPATIKVNPKEIKISLKDDTITIDTGDDFGLDAGDVDVTGGLVGEDALSSISFDGDNVTVTENGTITPKDAVIKNGTTDVTKNYSITYDSSVLKVTKLDIEVVTLPTPEKITYGDSLEDSSFTGGIIKDEKGNTVPGHFEWKTPETEPVVSDSNTTPYTVVFVPDDSSKYDNIEFDITVEVGKKDLTVEAPASTTVSKDDEIDLDVDDLTVIGLVDGDKITEVSFDGSTSAVGKTTVTPNEDSIVIIKDASGVDVTENYNITVVSGDLNVVKVKITPDGDVTVGKITYGDELSDSTITYPEVKDENGDVVPGTWSWKTPDVNPEVKDSNSTDYVVVFTPTDTTKYDPIEISKKVTVDPKKITISITETPVEIIKNDPLGLDKDDVTVTGGLADGDSLDDIDFNGNNTVVTDNGEVKPKDAVIKKDGRDVTENYEITYEEALLKVGKIPATIITPPTQEELTYGDSLGDSELKDWVVKDKNGDVVPGHFEWVTPDVVPEVSDSGITQYELVFIPDDEDTYDRITYPTTATVNPKSLKDDDIEIIITPDEKGNPVIVIKDDGEVIEIDEDYEVEIVPTGEDDISEIIITGKDNYKGEVKIKYKKVYEGKIVSDVNIDESAKEYEPDLEEVSKKDAEFLLGEIIEEADLPDEKKEFAEKIIDEISKSPDGTSENGGYDAHIYLEISEQEEAEVPAVCKDSVKSIIEAGEDINGTRISPKAEIGAYLDLSLYMNCTVSDEDGIVVFNLNKVPIKDTSEKAFGANAFKEKIEITIPKNLKAPKGYTRKYYVVRAHEEENGSITSEILESKKVGNKISFYTDKFSTYALLYKDTKKPVNRPINTGYTDPVPVAAPKTSDTGFGYFAMAVTFIGVTFAGIFLTIIGKRRKVEVENDETDEE
ncbi:MAG: hypothetical protein MJ119_00515 [Lachnospiraceae bacterium]|nr:hypothetical protein [Lachnospiraceae bacterium]